MLASSSDLTAETFDPFSRDLLLVAALGGLEGVECLKVATGLVPDEFMAEKSTYVGRIVNSVLPADKQLSIPTFSSLLVCKTPSFIRSIHQPPTSNIRCYWNGLHSVSCSSSFTVHRPWLLHLGTHHHMRFSMWPPF